MTTWVAADVQEVAAPAMVHASAEAFPLFNDRLNVRDFVPPGAAFSSTERLLAVQAVFELRVAMLPNDEFATESPTGAPHRVPLGGMLPMRPENTVDPAPEPAGPVAPTGPCGPLGPDGPDAPWGPPGPDGPDGPFSPGMPWIP